MNSRTENDLTTIAAMAIDSDNACRMRLKLATQPVSFFKSVTLVSSVDEGLSRIEASERDIDLVFLSERLPRELVNGFIKRAKELPRSQDGAFILLLSGTTHDDSAKAAQSLLAGFDGCLAEPYSVDALTEISQLATRVKHERREAREKAAVTFLLNDITKQIDRLAYIRGAEMDVGDTLKRLRDACSTFNNFDHDSMSRYYEIAAKVFEMAQPNAVVTGRLNYRGVSKRIKKKMAQHVIEQADGQPAPGAKKDPTKN